MAEPKSGSRDQSVASALKILAILDFVGEHGPSTFAEIAKHMGLPKSTLFRLLGTLCEAGFLERKERGHYSVTVKVWRIGASAIGYDVIHSEIASALQTLTRQTGETTHYSIYENGHAVYVDKVDGLHPVRAYSRVGGRSPAYASATGKALLAHQAPEEIRRVAGAAEPHTGATLGSAAIIDQMAEVRRDGYAVNHGEWREDVWGVAAPVTDHRGLLTGAIGISGPRGRIEPSLDQMISTVRATAAELTERHGGTGPGSGAIG